MKEETGISPKGAGAIFYLGQAERDLNTKDTKVTKEDLKTLCVLRVLCV
jgi:hypothetical protein